MQVQTLVNPSSDEFRKTMESLQPTIVYLQGEQVQNDEVGSLMWGGVALSTVEAVCSLFDTTLPTTVCCSSLSISEPTIFWCYYIFIGGLKLVLSLAELYLLLGQLSGLAL